MTHMRLGAQGMKRPICHVTERPICHVTKRPICHVGWPGWVGLGTSKDVYLCVPCGEQLRPL